MLRPFAFFDSRGKDAAFCAKDGNYVNFIVRLMSLRLKFV